MDETLDDLERVLLSNPMDQAARRRYADALLDADRPADSLAQYRLLLAASPGDADLCLGAALAAKRSGHPDEAKSLLDQARSGSGFDLDDPRLAELGAAPAVPSLRAIDGGRTDLPVADVISIGRADTVRLADVVGMAALKKVLRLRIIEPFARPGLFARFKKKAGGGVLLYGPPGCGKTMIARAIATECEASFTPIGISDVLNLWIGESERNLASLFDKARSEAPAVLFFDELDALAYARSKSQADHRRSIVNEFLNQLDGMAGANDKVLVLAATNMPWDVDEAMKRPGRFDRQIFVPPPDAAARAEMFAAKLRDVPTDRLDFGALAKASESFSGADIDGVIDRAKEEVLADILSGGEERNLRQTDLAAALEDAEPTTLEWLKTARNLVKFGGGGRSYKDVEKYLRAARLY